MARTLLPVKPYWAITVYKPQGQILENAYMYFDVREAWTSLTFVVTE